MSRFGKIDWYSFPSYQKWRSFWFNYRWSDYVSWFDGWIARIAIVVPVVGYLILFNDYVSEKLSFNILAQENTTAFGLSSRQRLTLLYFGLLALGLSNFLYRIRRPHVLKLGKSLFEYQEKALQHFTLSNYINIHDTIRHEGHATLHGKYYDSEYDMFLELAYGKHGKNDGENKESNWQEAKNKYESLLRSMLIDNYSRYDRARRSSLSACILIALAGYLFLAIPSIDLFVKVLMVAL